MRRIRLIIIATLLVICTTYLGFLSGTELGEQYLKDAARTERIHHQLSDLRGCMYAMDSDTLRFILNQEQEDLMRVLHRTSECREFIKEVGANAIDEELSGTLGEIVLFYDGYTATLQEILARQITLKTLLTKAAIDPDPATDAHLLTLTKQQLDAITTTRNFLDRLTRLIVRAW